MGSRLFINRSSSPASAIFYRLPSNQPRIRPDARRRQLRVSLASPRYLVVGWRRGDFSHARPSRIRHRKPARLEWAFVDALPCALNDRLLRLLGHVRPPHQTTQAYAMLALASSIFGTRRALADARQASNDGVDSADRDRRERMETSAFISAQPSPTARLSLPASWVSPSVRTPRALQDSSSGIEYRCTC